jgi:hypothetical protein
VRCPAIVCLRAPNLSRALETGDPAQVRRADLARKEQVAKPLPARIAVVATGPQRDHVRRWDLEGYPQHA